MVGCASSGSSCGSCIFRWSVSSRRASGGSPIARSCSSGSTKTVPRDSASAWPTRTRTTAPRRRVPPGTSSRSSSRRSSSDARSRTPARSSAHWRGFAAITWPRRPSRWPRGTSSHDSRASRSRRCSAEAPRSWPRASPPASRSAFRTRSTISPNASRRSWPRATAASRSRSSPAGTSRRSRRFAGGSAPSRSWSTPTPPIT